MGANNFRIMFHFSSSLWCFFCYVKSTLSALLLQQHIFNGIKITLLFGADKSCLMIKLFFGLSLWDTLYYVKATFFRFLIFQIHVFLITLEIRHLLVCSYYEWKYDTITLRVWSSFSDYSSVVCLYNELK